MKLIRIPYCSYVPSPGDYVIDRWDGVMCMEKRPSALVHCASVRTDGHDEYFCYSHWGMHLKKEHQDV